MSDTKPTVVEALSRVMAAVQAVRKGDRNQQQGYSFRGIDAVVNAVGPALREHGVIVVPHVEDAQYSTVEVGARRTPMRECTVRVRYVFHGPAGDTIECVSIGEAMDSGDKATPKAMSVAMRVALLQALCIPTDEPDVDSQSYERSPRQQRQRKPGREEIIARARQAIADAPDQARLDEIESLIRQRESEGAITADDAIELRRLRVARLDELFPAGEQQAIESAEEWPETAEVPA